MCSPPAPPRPATIDDTPLGVPRVADPDPSRRHAWATGLWLGCGLPLAWRGQDCWRTLTTSFDDGALFLALWQAWRGDPLRPRSLHVSAVEPRPCSAPGLRDASRADPAMNALAAQLAAQWHSLTPGVHRLVFEGGAVMLTLAVADLHDGLRQLQGQADSVCLTHTDPDVLTSHALKSVARHCHRGTRFATEASTSGLLERLRAAGFDPEVATPSLTDSDGGGAAGHADAAGLTGRFAPHWARPTDPAHIPAADPAPDSERHPAHQPVPDAAQTRANGAAPAVGQALVIGAGLAGSSVALSLARRGWQVSVLDRGARPAAGASGLPAGVLAPHVTADDNPLSRLTRAGVRATRARLAELMPDGQGWQDGGVLEHRVPEAPGALDKVWQRLAAAAPPPTDPAQGPLHARLASAQALLLARLPADAPALWHPSGASLQTPQLVRRQLEHPAITWRGDCDVAALRRTESGRWEAVDAQDRVLAQAELVVVAAGFDSRALLRDRLPLNALRGQVSMGRWPEGFAPVAQAVNGHGNLVPTLPGGGAPVWVLGSTFERGRTTTAVEDAGHAANFAKLQALLPAVAERLRPQFDAQRVQGWAAIRTTLPDRLPALGPVDPEQWPGLWACTGMGARGVSLSVLCGEMTAALLHDEPWPVEQTLGAKLLASRFLRRPPRTGE